jgi:tyrosine-protein phosphatase YwqE
LCFLPKNKSVLKDLIPDNHVDIHSHLLPGIDDGARTFEDSLRLTQALQSFGITQIITSSYIQHVWDTLEKFRF